MLVLGIVGSPRRHGRSNSLVDAALEGAASAGADTKKVYLGDYDIRPFMSEGGSEDGGRFCPAELSELCSVADALMIAAPVYWGDINGLTKDLMDSVRTANANGKPALGAAIAGGSGKGLLSGVQSIYHFFYHRQMRAIDPTPVSRFNWDASLQSLTASGAKLVSMIKRPEPFAGATADERWPEVVAYYATLPYLEHGPVDEFLMLARQLVAISDREARQEAVAELVKALAADEAGDRAAAGRHAVRCYQMLLF
jgi:NAD(P)H-dependent FMN reductase